MKDLHKLCYRLREERFLMQYVVVALSAGLSELTWNTQAHPI